MFRKDLKILVKMGEWESEITIKWKAEHLFWEIKNSKYWFKKEKGKKKYVLNFINFFFPSRAYLMCKIYFNLLLLF